jgi:hypothetical protein
VGREEILEQLLMLVCQVEDGGDASAAGDDAGVDPEAEWVLLRLWMDLLVQNPWLVPEGVFRLGPEEGSRALVAGAGYFLVGYLPARRELIAGWQEMEFGPLVA